jgi:hypothetical protein
MRKLCGRAHFHAVPLAALLSFVASTASADPITIPGYTVTDVGSGTSTFSAGASGNGILNAPNGQSYAFQQQSGTILTPGQGIAAGIPLLSPLSYPPDPSAAYVNLASAVMQPGGLVAAVDNSGVGDITYSQTAYFVEHNADGSWGQPIVIAQGPGQPAAGYTQAELGIVGITNANQLLINNLNVSGLQSPNALLYNVNNQTTTNLGTLLLSAGYSEPQGLAIDADGRILLSAVAVANDSTGLGPHQTELLLTPDGLSPDPIQVPVPEPGALAVMLVAIAGFVTHRICERNGQI